jgi:hypothetical protein
VLFAASAAATAGAAGVLFAPVVEARPARRLALAGCAAEVVTEQVMEHHLGEVGDVYDEGDAGRYARAAKALTLAGGALLGVAGRRPWLGRVGAALVLGGGLCQRWAVFRAGFQSARDPRYTVVPQRREAGPA